jgi:3-oxoacyl-[acyl-carrier protein] reductase
MASSAPASSLHLPLKGKVAIVTGGSRGIGAGIAIELGRRGADVRLSPLPNGQAAINSPRKQIILLHSSKSSESLAHEVLRKVSELPNPPHTLSIAGNLKKAEDPSIVMQTAKRWIEHTFPERGPAKVHILVNNAGVELVKPLGEITPEDFASVYDLNVRGTLLMTQAVLPFLAPRGRIINISSVGARCGFPSLSLYCSSKAAIEGLTRCWAAELGGNGTTVNAVSPGPVESEMLDNIPKEIVEKQKRDTPLQNRVGTVEEIASVAGFLAGEESSVSSPYS